MGSFCVFGSFQDSSRRQAGFDAEYTSRQPPVTQDARHALRLVITAVYSIPKHEVAATDCSHMNDEQIKNLVGKSYDFDTDGPRDDNITCDSLCELFNSLGFKVHKWENC